MNPWPLLGGIAKTICKEEDIIRPDHAEVGDVIVLTKPLGNSLMSDAIAISRNKDAPIKHSLSEKELDRGYRVAEMSMARTNKTGKVNFLLVSDVLIC